jgi:tetratricopeptide (TPR) repeat protein
MRRNRWFASTAAVFLGLLLAGSIASSLLISWQNEQLKATESDLIRQNHELDAALSRATSAETILEKAPEVFEKRGVQFFEDQKYQDAVKMFDGALILDTDAYESRLFRARSLTHLSQFKDAELAFAGILNTPGDQRPTEALVHRALLFNIQNRYDDAIDDLELALAQPVSGGIHDDDVDLEIRLWPEAMQLMFLAYWNSGAFPEAEQVRQKILQQSEKFLSGNLLCINAIHESGFGTRVAATEGFHRALRWYEFRFHSQPGIGREIVIELIKTCNEVLDTTTWPRRIR